MPASGVERQEAEKKIEDRSDSAHLDSLLHSIAMGDRQAVKALYDEIAPRLLAVLIRMVRRREVAEDLLQDVFLTVWKKAGSFDASRGNALTWLMTIARRKAIDRLRVSKRERLGAEEDVAVSEPEHVSERPRVDIESKISIQNCIGALTEDLRKALKLCYDYGLTHEELAEELGVPLGTAKGWVRRGLLQLRLCLENQ